MLPPDFDALAFLNEYKACYQWLTELSIDPETGLNIGHEPLGGKGLLDTKRPLSFQSQSDIEFALPGSALATIPSLHPHFVYIKGFSKGAHQEGLRGHRKSESLKDIHKVAPPEDFDIRVLGALQISVDELCAVSPKFIQSTIDC